MKKALIGSTATMALAMALAAAPARAADGCCMDGCQSAPLAATTQPSTPAPRYICPMDKDVTSDKPGKCPKCGMKLVPEKKADAPSPAGGEHQH